MSTVLALETRAVRLSMGSALVGYPAVDFLDRVDELQSLSRRLGVEDEPAFLAAFHEQALDDVRSGYFEAFEHRGANPLHETSWGQGQGPGRGAVLADVAAFYRAFGLDISQDGGEMLDHLGVQLEFYAVLLVKEAVLQEQGDLVGVKIVGDARRSFLKDHLAPLTYAAAGNDAAVQDPLWRSVLEWVRDVINGECRAENVTAAALGRFTLEPEGEAMNCAENPKLPVVQ